jgi:hypothetical protein
VSFLRARRWSLVADSSSAPIFFIDFVSMIATLSTLESAT